MTSYLPKDASDEVLKVIRASQQTVVDVVRAWADAVSPMLQSVPAVPFAAQLPKPEDVVTGAYDFAEKFLASQRQFSEELLKAAAPLVPSNEQRETAAAV
jgi:hypothetical protein